ncbi:hypothetical protein F2P56_001522 [Juglans regia]|uniref:Uncharacterized protein n=1 Tax=Juglans regia TaxID=51240 RepID=A0A833Y8N1_JUGRE|nr:hypothetical protein F2P56_001522 [Juglans regia]
MLDQIQAHGKLLVAQMVPDNRVNHENLPLLPDIHRNSLLFFCNQFGANEVEKNVEAVEAYLALAEFDGDEGLEPAEAERYHGTRAAGVDGGVRLIPVEWTVEVLEGVELRGGVVETS